MTESERDEIFRSAISKWGERSQIEMLQEEATELALAARKYIRNGDLKSIKELASEIADVNIMITQVLYMIPGIKSLIDSEDDFKIRRLRDRVNE